jgi:hypothetical protein
MGPLFWEWLRILLCKTLAHELTHNGGISGL